MRRVETVGAVLASGLVLLLGARFFTHAGPLWRDDVHTLRFATAGTYAQMLDMLDLVSLPALYPTLLRAWVSLGWPDLDFAVRLLGLAVTGGLVATVWLAARAIDAGPPLLALTLFGTHAFVLQISGSVRPYGLGSMFLAGTLVATWRLLRFPRASTFALAAALAVLTVHTQYQNAVLVAAICVAAALVAALSGQGGRVAAALGVGALAAVSLLVYLAVYVRSESWRALNSSAIDLAWLPGAFGRLLSAGDTMALLLWIALAVLTGIATVASLRAGSLRIATAVAERRTAYAGLVMLGGVAGTPLFFWLESRIVQPWHVVPLLALLGVGLDAVFVHPMWPRGARLGLAVAALAVTVPTAWGHLALRQTNVDLIARQLEAAATAADLIVVNPWYVGITFRYYYRGPTRWMTIPPLDDTRTHRYDLVKERMMAARPLAPLHAAMEDVLRRGHRLWVVGSLTVPPPGTAPVVLPPAPDAPMGWADMPYTLSWSMQTGSLVQTHAVRWGIVPVVVEQPVSHFEDLELLVVEGWREAAAQ